MSGRLIQSVDAEGVYDYRNYQYALNRFLAMIEEQKLKISDADRQEVKNYIFQGVKLESASMFQKLADKCLMEAQEHFTKK
jgi:hypothetical protein